MIEVDNQSDLTIPIETLESITNSLTNKSVDLLVTGNKQIREINREYRSIDKATDVLSFPFEDLPMAPLGSIVISSDYVNALSSELEHTKSDELCLLYIHGLLHLLGYDHEVDNGEMREKEESIIASFDLPKSLIVRTQEK